MKWVKHHAAGPYKQINEFVTALRARRGGSAIALKFMILTAGWTGEVIGAQWIEIDLAGHTWTVPADRMKAGKEHRVPLCDRAVVILNSIKSNRNPD